MLCAIGAQGMRNALIQVYYSLLLFLNFNQLTTSTIFVILLTISCVEFMKGLER